MIINRAKVQGILFKYLKWILLAIVLLVFVILAVVTISRQRSIKELYKAPYELEEVLYHSYGANGFNGTWISDDSFLYRTFDNEVVMLNMSSKTISVFLDRSVLDQYPIADMVISPDLLYVLLKYNVSSVFRHSVTAQYTVYDIAKRQYYHLANQTPLQLAKFADTGHRLVYVFENNIYFIDDFVSHTNNPVPITVVGIPGVLYCGVADWVYEEEVLNSGSALWFSPDAEKLAYAVFDDAQVRNLSYTIYGQPGTLESQYPHEATIRYPKAGTPNPVTNIYLYDMTNKQTRKILLPEQLSNTERNDFIFYGLTWISPNELAIVCTNRVQNESYILRCSTNGSCKVEDFRKEPKGWITPTIPKYSKDGTKRLEVIPQPEGDDKYDHLVVTDVSTNTKTQLTRGKFNVLSLNEWNEDGNLIYYTANTVANPSQQNEYSVDLSGKINCITCFFSVDEVPCMYGALLFSKALSYYTKMCLGPNVPLVAVQNAKDDNDYLIWEDNFPLRVVLTYKLQPIVKDLEVPVGGGFSARVRLYLPPNLDEKSDKKYPAIVDTYAGPGSNHISNTYLINFKTYLVTKREYIYIYIDGRGSGKEGYNKQFELYRKLGTVEVEDQIQVTKFLQEHLPYIDAKRTGIWGWSYGGFCSSWALARDKDHIFKAAIAVAPVTNFIYYDSIYTERYMGLPTPDDNEKGYNYTDLTHAVEGFRGRNYFIIHGNADDNVHYQNSMMLVKALELADIDFRQHSYPDENHSLGHVSPHLYHMMDKYWAEIFDIKNLDGWSQKESE